MADTSGTTRPARPRSTAAKAVTPAPKSAPTAARRSKVVPKATPSVPEGVTVGDGRVTIELDYHSDTSRYSKFVVPEDFDGGVVGTIYAPHGTYMVKVLVVAEAPANAEEDTSMTDTPTTA